MGEATSRDWADHILSGSACEREECLSLGKSVRKTLGQEQVWGMQRGEGDQLDWKSICTWKARGKSGSSWEELGCGEAELL